LRVVPPSDNKFFRAYGQFSCQAILPFESGGKSLPGRKGRGLKGSIQVIGLPSCYPLASLSSNSQQSYWAGRSLIRIHGSGDATILGKKVISYLIAGWNPTIGCLRH